MIPFQVITIQSIAFLKEQQNHRRSSRGILLLRIQKHSVALLNNSVGVSLAASRLAFFQELLHASGTGAWSHLLPGNPTLFKVWENQGNEFAQQLPVFNAVLFLQEVGSSCEVFKYVDLFWAVLGSGGEQILWYKWDRSELMI